MIQQMANFPRYIRYKVNGTYYNYQHIDFYYYTDTRSMLTECLNTKTNFVVTIR